MREDLKHNDLLEASLQTQEVILKSFSSLVSYLSNSVSKTEVVNQLREIGTPDAMKVVEAVNSLHETLRTHENTDLTEITAVMRSVLDEVSKIPKDHPEPVEIPEHEEKDYSEQLKSLEDTVKAVEKAVTALDLNVEVKSPVVNVPQARVDVEAPDLAPIEKGLVEVKKAVQKLIFPDSTKEVKEINKKLDKTNKLLYDIWDKPVGGGGGGGSVPSFQDINGMAVQARLESDGSLPVTIKSGGGSGSSATALEQSAQTDILEEIQSAVQGIAAARGVASDLRVTIVGGTVNTVSTLTNQTQMGGFMANNQIPAMMNLAAQANINNVVVT